MDYTKDLHELCETLSDQLGDLTRKVKNSGMSGSDLEMIDKLTHSIKSIKAIMAMMEESGYSGHYPYMGGYGYGTGSYDDGAYRGGSYAKGRNQRRDSMGRYSGERGYSRNDLADKMRELMADAPDDQTRREIQRMVDKLDQ